MNKILGSFSFGFCLKSNYEQKNGDKAIWEKNYMAFFQSAVGTLQTLVVALTDRNATWRVGVYC